MVLTRPTRIAGSVCVRQKAYNVSQMTSSPTLPPRRRARGLYSKSHGARQISGENRRTSLPEYLEAPAIDSLIAAAPHARARLMMLIQWRAGLRVSEALALEVRDLLLEGDRPTMRVRDGKGGRSRIVPIHPELRLALEAALSYSELGRGSTVISASRATASRWVASAVRRAKELGAIPAGCRVSTHTLRHSYARHLLTHGIQINALSRWLGHSSIATTLIYLELVPDPIGSLEAVP